MNDSDVDDLAKVLYARFGAGEPENHELWRWHAAGVLASGVVVSARDVKALADKHDRMADAIFATEAADDEPSAAMVGRGIALQLAAKGERSLLREPATDAAPTGEAQGQGCNCHDHPDVLLPESGEQR